MHERGIRRADVIRCLESGEIIEDYPDDFPHPSCLVFGRTAANDVPLSFVQRSLKSPVLVMYPTPS